MVNRQAGVNSEHRGPLFLVSPNLIRNTNGLLGDNRPVMSQASDRRDKPAASRSMSVREVAEYERIKAGGQNK